MIHDCSYYARRAELLAQLEEIAGRLLREDAILDWQLADAMHYGKAWTDPRTGVTHFPPRRS